MYTGTRTPTVEYIVTCDEILVTLCRGYRNQDICHNTGHMLRYVPSHLLKFKSVASVFIAGSAFCTSLWQRFF